MSISVQAFSVGGIKGDHSLAVNLLRVVTVSCLTVVITLSGTLFSLLGCSLPKTRIKQLCSCTVAVGMMFCSLVIVEFYFLVLMRNAMPVQ